MTERVVITGLGVVSLLGASLEVLTERFAAGSRAASSTASGDEGGELGTIPMDTVPEDKRSRVARLDRICQFLLSASYSAVEAAGLTVDAENTERVGLSFGTGLGCLLTNEEYNRKIVEGGPSAASPRLFAYTVSSAAAGEVSIALGIKGPNLTAHMGLTAGLGAIGYGFDLIQLGKADVVLAGGADVIGPALLQGLGTMGLLKERDQMTPFRDSVPGVCPAEGAAVAVLERLDYARARRAPRLACIDGYAAGFEPTLTRSERQSTGVTATMRRALSLSGHDPGGIGLVLASAHGTPVDDTERAALVATFGSESGPLVLTPKAMLAESFGAGGALALALAAGLLQRVPALADELAVAVDGTPLSGAEVRRRLEDASAVMVSSLCYTGNVVALVLGREERE